MSFDEFCKKMDAEYAEINKDELVPIAVPSPEEMLKLFLSGKIMFDSILADEEFNREQAAIEDFINYFIKKPRDF